MEKKDRKKKCMGRRCGDQLITRGVGLQLDNIPHQLIKVGIPALIFKRSHE